MLNFLRKLRRKEMNQNTGKYLKYAIGEIALVVIGILIALSVNNGNIRNKERALAQEYKERLVNQFQKDSVQWFQRNQGLISLNEIVHNVDTLFMQKANNTLKLNDIIKIPVFLTLDSPILTATTAIDELNNTGRMSLFKNILLKDALVSYQNEISNQINTYNKVLDKYTAYDEYLIKNGILNNRLYFIEARYLTDEFKNRYWFVATNRMNDLRQSSVLVKKCNDILKLLRD